MASNKVEMIRNMIGELTAEETETLAITFMCELSDTDLIQAIVQTVGADDVCRDELIAQLEDM